MTAVMALRARYKESFEKKHGVKLGFMSLLRQGRASGAEGLPAVNAEIDGDDIVYKNHYDIGVAVGTERGPGGAGGARRRPALASPRSRRRSPISARARATAS